jgi:hypothetical protein
MNPIDSILIVINLGGTVVNPEDASPANPTQNE